MSKLYVCIWTKGLNQSFIIDVRVDIVNIDSLNTPLPIEWKRYYVHKSFFECDLFVYKRKLNVLLSFHEKNVGANFCFSQNNFSNSIISFAMFFYDAFLHFVQNNRIDRTIFIRVCQCQNAKTVSVKSCISRSNKNI